MSVPRQINNAYSGEGSAVTTFGNAMYAVWKGPGTDNRLWWSQASFTSWEGWATVYWSQAGPIERPHFETTLPPCLTEPGTESIAMFWRSASDNSIWYATYAGNRWSDAAQIPGAESTDAPAGAYYQGNLVAAWRGADEKIYWSVLPPAPPAHPGPGPIAVSQWSAPVPVPSASGTDHAPCLTAGASALHLFWKGEGNDNAIYQSSWNGQTWSARQAVPGAATDQGPMARAARLGTVATDTIWLAWRDVYGDIDYSSSASGGPWATALSIYGASSSFRPALAGYDDIMFVFWTDQAGNSILWGPIQDITPPPPPPPTQFLTTPPATWKSGGIDTIGAQATITVGSDGTFDVQFDIWNGPGVLPYNYQIRAYLIGPNFPAFVFSYSGSIGTDVTKRVNETVTESGSNPLIAINWGWIQLQSQVQIFLDLQYTGPVGAVVKVVEDVLGFAAGAVLGVVIGVTADALKVFNVSLGPGDSIGVISGVLVFAIAAVAGLGVGSAAILGIIIGNVVGAVASAAITSREMNSSEIEMASKVFQSSLNYGKVKFCNLLAKDGRAFTAPGPDGFTYCCFGAHYANDMSQATAMSAYPVAGEMMIHELTHAWQIQHNGFPAGYLCSAIINQTELSFGDNVYLYGPPGPPWNTFNVEQQGQIVNEWFAGSGQQAGLFGPQALFLPMDPNDPYAKYIQNNILTGSAGYSTNVVPGDPL